MRYKEALTNASCPNCGGPAALGEMSFDEHHLRMENARLREEVPISFFAVYKFTYDFVIPVSSSHAFSSSSSSLLLLSLVLLNLKLSPYYNLNIFCTSNKICILLMLMHVLLFENTIYWISNSTS